jgi:hypothetical protein
MADNRLFQYDSNVVITLCFVTCFGSNGHLHAYLYWTTKVINHEVSVHIKFLLLEDFYINI